MAVVLDSVKLINLTPHPIVLVLNEGEGPRYEVPPSGEVVRCIVERTQTGSILIGGNSVPVYETKMGELDFLPPERLGTAYIVSARVAQSSPERTDFFIPDDVLRDEKGRIIGCRALARPV